MLTFQVLFYGGSYHNSHLTTWKVSKYGVFSGPYFPAFGLNTEIYGVNFCIQSEYRKIRTRINSVCGHFWRSVCLMFFWLIASVLECASQEFSFEKHPLNFFDFTTNDVYLWPVVCDKWYKFVAIYVSFTLMHCAS